MGIIIKPLVTEKMTAITDKLNRFGFVVRPDANKLEIKGSTVYEQRYAPLSRNKRCQRQ